MALAYNLPSTPGRVQNAQSAEFTQKTHGVTELVLAQQSDAMSLVLPMISHLSKQDKTRWMTWIAPQGITRQMLDTYGVDTQRLRIIHADPAGDYCWMIWEALRSGTSHTVIANPGFLPEKAINQLDAAAKAGNCDGLLLRFR